MSAQAAAAAAVARHVAWSGQTMAAWVQAIGSIAAILAAVWLQDRQRRLDRLQELAEMLSALRGVACEARWLSECALKVEADDLSDEHKRQYRMPLGGPIVPAVAAALDEFDISRLPTGQLVEALLTARIHMKLLAGYCDKTISPYELSFPAITHYLVVLEDRIAAALKTLPLPVIPSGPTEYPRITTPEERRPGERVATPS